MQGRVASGREVLNIRSMRIILCIVCWFFTVTGSTLDRSSYSASDDASWAIFSANVSSLLSTDRQNSYKDFVEGCNRAIQLEKPEGVRHNFVSECVKKEEIRINMNRLQPRSSYNFTELGYAKRRAPRDLFESIKAFYDKNKAHSVEEWPTTNNYQNTWDCPSTLVRLEDQDLDGGGPDMQEYIWSSMKQAMEEWVGLELRPVSLYGIRQYHRGSILAPHVDRMPLVVSAIINIDQEGIEEPWVLEVYGHDGKATNISMDVGDMILYESHSVIHGRPFPLLGDIYANVFLHFEPLDAFDAEGESLYDPDLDIPPYVIPGSPWEEKWWEANEDGWKGAEDFWDEGDARLAAHRGDLETLREIAEIDPDFLHEADDLGWLPLHEAARSGKLLVLQLLLENDADVNDQTIYGHTALQIARNHHGDDHEVTRFLMNLSAEDTGPEL